MRRPDDTLDPRIARELDELERALAGEPVQDAELAELVRDLRAEAPVMRPAFRAQLGERVLQGFPRSSGPRAWLAHAAAGRRAALLPALGAAASVLLVVVVLATAGGGLDGGGGDDEAAGGGSEAPAVSAQPQGGDDAARRQGATEDSAGSSEAAPQSTPQADAGTGAAAPTTPAQGAAPPVAGEAPRTGPRKVERNAQLTLTTSAGDVQDVADGVVRTTQALGGYVQTSQVATDDTAGTATFRLRLPTPRLDEAIARLSRLADVGSLQQGATDITGSFSSASARLADARAERRALLRALGRATTEGRIASLRERLRINRSQIASRKGEVEALRRRAHLASVDVTVEGRGKQRDEGGAWTPGDAAGDALRVLQVAAGVALVAGALLVPVALLAALVALATRASRRRRREAALDLV